MLKILCVTLLIASGFQSNSANIIPYDVVSFKLNPVNPVDVQPTPELSPEWERHINDFLELVDIDKLLSVIMGYLTDPEVMNFITFIFSDEFIKVVWDFESIAEFKEAFKLLEDKGYELDSIIDYINSALELPPFEKPTITITRKGTGMAGLIEDLIAALPMEEFKRLFESKLETSPEVAELFETINSPEFMDIMKRMSKNPEFQRIKEIFKGYGLDFKYICNFAKEFFGEHYQGVFCETVQLLKCT